MRILIADPQDLARIGARSIVKSVFPSEDVVVTEADSSIAMSDALGTMNQAAADSAATPAVVIFDAVAMDMDMNNTLKEMAAKYPGIQWIILSSHIPAALLSFVDSNKAFSIISKDCVQGEIAECIKVVGRKEQYIYQKGMKTLYEMSKKTESLLTPSECDILKMLAQGLKVKDIAERQNRSRHTIRTHKRNIFAKLKVNSVVNAIKTAKSLELI